LEIETETALQLKNTYTCKDLGRTIARCGEHNAQRNLFNKVATIISVYYITLHLDAGPEGQNIPVKCAVLNLYELFAAMFDSGFQQFLVSWLGTEGTEAPEQFWSAAAKSPFFAGLPCLQKGLSFLQCLIPILFFYDGADVFRDKEVYWFLASSATTWKCNEWDSEFPLLGIPAEFVTSNETLRRLFWDVTAWLKWNITILESGFGPTRGFYNEKLTSESMLRFAGRALAGHWRATWAGNTGDYKSKKEWMGYSRYYRCRQMCEACLGEAPTVHANKSMSVFNFLDNAPWLQTLLAPVHVAALEDHTLPLQMFDGWHHELYHRDPAHTNALGQAKDSNACTCIALLNEGHLGPQTGDEALRKLHSEFDNFCINNGMKIVSAPRLTLRVLGRGESQSCYPELASSWKAAPTIMLTHFLANKTKEVMTVNRYQQLVATHMWALAEFQHVCSHGGIELWPREQARAAHAGKVYLLTLQELAGIARASGVFMWRTRPKNHYFDHLVHVVRRSPVNPQLFDCLKRESMLGKLKRIGRSCHKRSMPTVTLHKYLIAQTQRVRVRQQLSKFDLRNRSIPKELTARNSKFQQYKASLCNTRLVCFPPGRL
jgi:hypothetical protein